MASPRDVLRNGFPGPSVAGVALVLAPVVLLAMAVLLVPFESGVIEEEQAALAAEPARADLSLNLYVLGWALAVPCIVVVARLAAVERPALASFGGLLTLAGVTVSIFWGGISTFEHGLALFADRAVATAALEAGDPPAVVYLLLPGIPLGWPLLALAAWRGGVLPVWRAAALALVGTIPFWVLGGFPMLLPLPFVAMAVAFVPLGLALLRDGGAEKEGSAREAE